MRIYVLFIVFLLSIYGCADSKRSNSVSTIMLNDRELIVFFFDKLKTDTVAIPLSRLVYIRKRIHNTFCRAFTTC